MTDEAPNRLSHFQRLNVAKTGSLTGAEPAPALTDNVRTTDHSPWSAMRAAETRTDSKVTAPSIKLT